jgi:hypothetical protein
MEQNSLGKAIRLWSAGLTRVVNLTQKPQYEEEIRPALAA